MKKKSYVYYAIFNFEDDGIFIHFPDLPGCISCGFTIEEAIFMAKDALALYLEGTKEVDFPRASPRNKIKVNSLKDKIYPIEIIIN